jgi:hypothetical protein
LVDGCDASGQRIPFAATKAARGSDPRLSLRERYGNPSGSNANYVAAVTAAANALVADRFLLRDSRRCAGCGDLHHSGESGRYPRQSLNLNRE